MTATLVVRREERPKCHLDAVPRGPGDERVDTRAEIARKLARGAHMTAKGVVRTLGRVSGKTELEVAVPFSHLPAAATLDLIPDRPVDLVAVEAVGDVDELPGRCRARPRRLNTRRARPHPSPRGRERRHRRRRNTGAVHEHRARYVDGAHIPFNARSNPAGASRSAERKLREAGGAPASPGRDVRRARRAARRRPVYRPEDAEQDRAHRHRFRSGSHPRERAVVPVRLRRARSSASRASLAVRARRG